MIIIFQVDHLYAWVHIKIHFLLKWLPRSVRWTFRINGHICVSSLNCKATDLSFQDASFPQLHPCCCILLMHQLQLFLCSSGECGILSSQAHRWSWSYWEEFYLIIGIVLHVLVRSRVNPARGVPVVVSACQPINFDCCVFYFILFYFIVGRWIVFWTVAVHLMRHSMTGSAAMDTHTILRGRKPPSANSKIRSIEQWNLLSQNKMPKKVGYTSPESRYGQSRDMKYCLDAILELEFSTVILYFSVLVQGEMWD